MRCPNCGQDNTTLATRCATCGATLSEASTTKTMSTPHDNTASAPTATVETSSRVGGLGPFLAAHQRALGIGLAAAVLVVLGVVYATLTLTDAPAYQQIESDMATLMPSYQYAGGAYGPDLNIPLSSVAVTNRAATQTPEGMKAAPGVGPTAYKVEAEATFDDGRMRVVREVAATYVRTDDGWQVAGELTDQGTSLEARAGVDEDKVLANMDTVLKAASKSDDEALAELYADGSFKVVGNDFEANPDHDTATDTVVVRCSKSQDFYAYEGNLTAQFAFESGAWQLRSAEADASAGTRTYGSLVGTWTGELVEHDALGGSCFGAEEHPVRIVIESMGDASAGSGQVQGTISCVGHFHERLDDDAASSPSDQLIEDRAFWGELSTRHNRTTDSSLNIECTTAGGPDGELDFVLSFGTSDDPSAVVARVTTTHAYEEKVFFLLPHQITARFTDTYVLTRTG